MLSKISSIVVFMSLFVPTEVVFSQTVTKTATPPVRKEIKIKHEFKKITIPDAVATRKAFRDGTLMDSAVVPFLKTNGGIEYYRQNRTLPQGLLDRWGYPQKVTFFKSKIYESRKSAQIEPKQNQKSAFLDRWLKVTGASSAMAEEMDSSLPGVVRCRANSNVQGYFKAYFEDLVANNGTSNGQDYAHPVKGPARRQAVCEVLQEIATIVKLDQSPSPVTPDIVFASSSGSIPSSALAAAGAYYHSWTSTTTLDNGTLHSHIISKMDPTPNVGQFDAIVYTNFANTIQWSVDSTLNPNSYDFKTVMRHEIFHALGFADLIPEVVSPGMSSILHNRFSEFLYEKQPNSNANRYFSFPTSQTMNPLFQVPPGAQPNWYVNDGVVYQGQKNLVNAVSDPARPVFSPPVWMGGSSLAHFDDDRAPGIHYVMNPSASKGVALNYHQHELEVLCHLGYQVLGMAGCEGATPVAKDDTVLMTTSTYCLPFLANDLSFTASNNLKVESLETIVAPAPGSVTYFLTASCTAGTETISIENARAIRITSTQPSAFRYRIKDVSTMRISQPALISITSCQAPAGELVCNGDFELGPSPGSSLMDGYNNAFGNYRVPFWAAAKGSPDLVFKNRPGYGHSMCNLAYQEPTSGVFINMQSANSQFAAFIANSTVNQYTEIITTGLREPLQVGQSYEISFHVRQFKSSSMNPPPADTNRIYVGFSTSPMDEENPNAVPVSSAQTIVNQLVPLDSQSWTPVTKTFQATQAHKYIVLHMPTNSNWMMTYLDNISVKKVGVVPLTSHTISGKVFKDNVIADGVQQPVEQGLDGVSIGLFDSPSAAAPIQIVQSHTEVINGSLVKGLYSFPQSGMNLLPSNQYYLAIVPESNFAAISLPATNAIMSNFQHAIPIPFANGGNVTGKDFGVRLNGDAILTVTMSYVKICSSAQYTATVSGGQAPYAFQWSTGQTGASVLLPTGTHTLTVTDANGAYTYKTVTVAPYQFSLTATPSSATGTAYTNGKITANVSGGVGPYTYNWLGGNAGGTVGPITQNYNVRTGIPGSASNEYSVYVVDSNGCTSNTVSQIRVLKALTIKRSIERLCTPTPDSSMISFSAVGGHPPYALQWRYLTSPSNWFPSTPAPSSLLILGVSNGVTPAFGPGSYELKVSDSQNQTVIQTVQMPSIPPLAYNATIVQPTTGASNGSISINVVNGWNSQQNVSPVYTYSWSDGVSYTGTSTHTRTNLPVGEYTLTVTMGNTTCETTTKTFYLNGSSISAGVSQ